MASIRDVAARAGVAPSTVSLVLNKRPNVSPDIKSAVEAAVSELKYSLVAKGRPRSSKTSANKKRPNNQVAFLITGSSSLLQSNSSYGKVLEGIQEVCDRNGKVLVVNAVTPDSPDLQFLAAKIDGAIFIGEPPAPPILNLLKFVPGVRAMGVPYENETWDHVTYDNANIGRMAADHLLSRGHKHCGYVRPYADGIDPADALVTAAFRHICDRREAGFCDTIRSAAGKISLNDTSAGGWLLNSHETLERSVRNLFKGSARPTAIFVPTDWMTRKVYAALGAIGVRPNLDVEIVSCDADFWSLEGLNPKPATIDIFARDIGRRCVQQLLQRLSGPTEPRTTILYEPALVTNS